MFAKKLEARSFVLSVEVVPPAGHNPEAILGALASLGGLGIDAFSVATNPVAKARMSALALCHLAQERTGRPAILHCTTRDHNRLALQSLLWGARALGIETVLCASGDRVGVEERGMTTTVGDLDVLELVRMARDAGLVAGVVFDPHPESNGQKVATRRLLRKADSGAQFAVTQPAYDIESARDLCRATERAGIPVLLGILPLRTHRHAEFLHEKVSGIAIPQHVRDRMASAPDPVAEGIAGARVMLAVARDLFQGACLMPPFDHYEVLNDILGPPPAPEG